MTTKQQRLHLTFVRNKTNYQSSLWGDTYLTPQEARIYLTQMLQMLRKEKKK
jgi:hypothetical protein